MTRSTNETNLGLAARAVSALAFTTGTVVWAHALAALWGHAPYSAVALTLAALAAAAAGALPRRPVHAASAAAATGTIVAGTLAVLDPATYVPALTVIPVAATMAAGGAWLAPRLPRALGTKVVRPGLAVLWVLLALVAVVQVSRLATFMTDRESDWFLSTRQEFYAKHECLNAYVYGAELDRRGEPNVYDAAHYPGLNPLAQPRTEIRGLSPEDPFQYPPTFLLLPRLAIEITDDFGAIRTFWFGVNVSLCLGAVLLLAIWVGGRVGTGSLILLPALIASFPVLHNFQYGQFHFAAVALAILGLTAFASRRPALGGTLLSLAILSKLFPAFLLVPLAVQRRWRDLAATAVAGALLVALALFVLGPEPFAAFLGHHLPRMLDGRAFAFGEAWPELAELVTAGNQGVPGMVRKLAAMGVPGIDEEVGRVASRIFMLLLVVAGIAVGLRTTAASRSHRAVAWLGLLGLASLASAGAWADYVPLTAVWTLTLLAPMEAARPGRIGFKLALALGAVLQVFLLGTMPLGDMAAPSWMYPVSLLGAGTLLMIFGSSVTAAARGVRGRLPQWKRSAPYPTAP